MSFCDYGARSKTPPFICSVHLCQTGLLLQEGNFIALLERKGRSSLVFTRYSCKIVTTARYNTWLLRKLTPKGVVFSFHNCYNGCHNVAKAAQLSSKASTAKFAEQTAQGKYRMWLLKSSA